MYTILKNYEHNLGKPEQRLQFRIGVHVGDVVVENGDLFGDGVNVAARLQALAEPGGVFPMTLVEGALRTRGSDSRQ